MLGWAGLALLLWSVLLLFVPSVEGHSCGLNAVRHRQDQQFRKLLGDDYQRRHRERRLQLLPFGTAPLTRLQKLLIASAPAAMRVKPVFQLDAGYLTPQQSQQLRGVLVPGAVNVLHQYIKVRLPASRPVKAVRESIDQYCGEADASVVFKGNGFNGTDQVFYFTAINTGSCSDNIIAYTIICHMEPFTYRPNVAAINLCPRFWALTEPNYNKQVSALVHEMVHGLGFSDRMYPFMYDSQNGVQYDEVVREQQLAPGPAPAGLIPTLVSTIPAITSALPTLPIPTLPGIPRFQADQGSTTSSSSSSSSSKTSGSGGDSSASTAASSSSEQAEDAVDNSAALAEAAQRKVLFLVTPKLQAFAREYYGCSSLPGAPADAVSEGSHWRQANINHELMQPASAEDSQRKRMSHFTLNFLDDTGWYVTDKSQAQELEWGRGAGCSFVLDGCSSYASSHKHQTYYCSAAQAGKDVCTYDSRGIGTCSAIPGSKCYTARAADTDKPLLYCQDSNSFSRAARQAFAASIAAVGGVVGAPSSRCFHTPQRICTGSNSSSSAGADQRKQQQQQGGCSGDNGSAVCMEAACDGSGKLFVLLRIDNGKGKKDTAKLACSDGATIDLARQMPTKFRSGQIVCPSANSVCPTLGCSHACINGYCWKGRCYCHMEFTGPSCSQSLVPQYKPAAKVSQPASKARSNGP